MRNLAKNYLSTMLFISIAYFFYVNNNYYKDFLIKDMNILSFNFNSLDVFHIIIIIYAILLIPFYIIENEKSKARIAIEYVWKKIKNNSYKIKKEEKNSILAWLVKAFFLPMMIIWLTGNIWFVIDKVYWWSNEIELLSSNFLYYFNTYLFAWILTFIFIIDLLFFTLWYMLESKYLWNKIKSVEPTLLWWAVVLICYPPFNISIEKVLWWYSSDYPTFDNMYIHITMNIIILITFAIYSRASVALWLKASNLTNRWIISRWPYKYIRHPAYATKNLARLIWALPIIILNIKELNIKMIILISISLILWFTIYYLRSITEERHLEIDPDYKEYKKKVKYKFIPKIY